ncbi:MAG: oligopeptide ABC transporter substrate-binding protein [Sporolactobacillus sp.]
MKKKSIFGLLSLILILSLVLSACGGSGSSSPQVTDKSKFPVAMPASTKTVKDGTLNVGLVSDTPFEGTFSQEFLTGMPDNDIDSWFEESLLYTADKNYTINNSGPATYKLSNGNKTVTITIRKDLKWSDGYPVTAHDLEYSFLVIGNKKYNGVRYDSTMTGIKGMTAYHAGKAKDISGVKVINSHKISITYLHADPTILTGLWTVPMPYHYLKGIAINKLAASPQIRKKPIGFGPFVVKKIVPGESVQLVRNDNYWNGKPKLKQVIIKIVNPNVAVASMKNGSVDYEMEFTNDQYANIKGLKNIKLLGFKDLAYSYIGFKLGHWDAKKGVNVMDNKKMQNVKLRQAMAYALDLKTASQKLYNGTYYPATSLIPPSFPGYFNAKQKGYTYDVKKANQLLDQAGYKKGKDGYRTDPQGKKFVIHFAAMSGSAVAEPLAKFYIQCWKKVGLDVQLVNGRLEEFNSFYNDVQNDKPGIDVYAAAWATGTDVNPAGLYGKAAMFNYPRFVNAQNEKLLAEGTSPKAFNHQYRQNVYNQWQALMKEQVPVIPTFFRYNLTPVNKRVTNFNVDPTVAPNLQDITVTSNTPVKGK